jgi:hypothetical protein
MAIDQSDITSAETKIDSALAADQATTIRDAMGNEISYQRPALMEQAHFYDWLSKRKQGSARTSMFDKIRFAKRGN